MKNVMCKMSVIAACTALAACGPDSVQLAALQAPPLEPAPVGAVTAGSLPPLGSQVSGTLPTGQGVPGQLPQAGNTGLAVGGSDGQDLQAIPTLPSQGTGVAGSRQVLVSPTIDFGRNAVLGAWNVSSQSDTCNLNLSLTTWTGGFRASTRKCSNPSLTGIGAWTLSGKQLLLLDTKGGPLARLVASGDNRFDGTTETGSKSISVFR